MDDININPVGQPTLGAARAFQLSLGRVPLHLPFNLPFPLLASFLKLAKFGAHRSNRGLFEGSGCINNPTASFKCLEYRLPTPANITLPFLDITFNRQHSCTIDPTSQTSLANEKIRPLWRGPFIRHAISLAKLCAVLVLLNGSAEIP